MTTTSFRVLTLPESNHWVQKPVTLFFVRTHNYTAVLHELCFLLVKDIRLTNNRIVFFSLRFGKDKTTRIVYRFHIQQNTNRTFLFTDTKAVGQKLINCFPLGQNSKVTADIYTNHIYMFCSHKYNKNIILILLDIVLFYIYTIQDFILRIF